MRTAMAFSPCRQAYKAEKDDRLSEANDHYILIASRFPCDSALAAKGDIHRGLLRGQLSTVCRRGQAIM
jgi:hypothetical protein